MVQDPRVNVDIESMDALLRALTELDLPATEEMAEQLGFFVEAMVLYEVRGHKYGDAWREYGATDCLFHMKSKVARLTAVAGKIMSGGHDLEIDDGIDLLNYAVFTMRNLLEGNFTGRGQ